jgi:SAM-dependent methyltransferase
MIDKDLVAACYRAILGREPESEAVVEDKIKWTASPEALIRDLLHSTEFQTHLPQRIADHYFYDRPQIDVDVSEAQRKALFDRLQRQWRALGDEEPFWSVLTHETYRAANLDQAVIDRFYETGADHAQLIELFCARTQSEIRYGTCVELGCGVGRVTKHLAARFEKVIALDISEGNLRECRAMAEKAGLSNIECMLLQSPEDITRLEAVDFFYSVIALQHSPPPIQKYMLDILLSKLRVGGGFLFQTQTYYPLYAFSIEEHLASSAEVMDMHSLPMHEALRLIDKHGHRIQEVMEDMWTGRNGSHTFFGLARASRWRRLRQALT